LTDAQQSKEKTEEANLFLQAAVERANIMARQALQANRAKNDFLANVSHEIRTPMNAVIGFGDLLAAEDLTVSQRELLDTIRNSSKNLLTLLNDILDFAKIEAGKMEAEVIDTDLSELLDEIYTFYKLAADRKGLDFEITIAGNVPAMIRTDPTRVRQCLINFISNAIKFTEEGFIKVAVSTAHTTGKDWLRFDVADSGIGIKPDKTKVIFESFCQGDGSTTRKFGGTGLGLAITKRLAELLGGRASVKSCPDEGSVFSLTIPCESVGEDTETLSRFVPRERIPQLPPAQLPALIGNVLVAEDNITNRRLITILLENLSIRTTAVDDGAKALEMACSERFDLIIMDIRMPDMNGHQAARKLRQKGITTPIIALTAGVLKEDREECIKSGCDYYLPKPVNMQKLYEILSLFLSTKDASPQPQVSETPDIISILAGNAALEPVIEVFLLDLPSILARINRACEKTDLEYLQSAAHDLKGASSSAGFMALFALARELEAHIKSEKIDAIAKTVEQISRLCERIYKKQTVKST